VLSLGLPADSRKARRDCRSRRDRTRKKKAGFIHAYAGVIAVDFGRAVIRLDDGELSREARAEVRSYKREIDHRLRSFPEEGIGEMVRTQMMIVRRLAKYDPVDTIGLGRQIAPHVLEAGRYSV